LKEKKKMLLDNMESSTLPLNDVDVDHKETIIISSPPRQRGSSSQQSLTTIETSNNIDEVHVPVGTTKDTPPLPPPPPTPLNNQSTAALLLSYANSTHKRLSSNRNSLRRSGSIHKRNLLAGSSPGSQHHRRTPKQASAQRKKKSSSFLSSASASKIEQQQEQQTPPVLSRGYSDGLVSSTSHSYYTEHTIHDDDFDDELSGYEEFADLEDNDDDDDDDDVSDYDDNSTEFGYYSDSGLPNQHHRHNNSNNNDFHNNRTPSRMLQQERSTMSLSCHTLSSAFTLNELGSAGTVSSLEADVDIDNEYTHVVEEIEEFVEDGNLISVEGVGILSLRTLNLSSSSHQRHQQQYHRTPSSSSSRRRRRQNRLPPSSSRLINTPGSFDTIDDTCSLDSDDRRIRQIEQKVEALHLREAFSHHHHHHQEKHGADNGNKNKDDEDTIEEDIVEEIIEEEIIVEETEFEEEEIIDDDYDFPEDRVDAALATIHDRTTVSSTLHASMAVNDTTCKQQRTTKQNYGTTSQQDKGCPERYSRDFDFEGEDAFPTNLSDAKQYLARLADNNRSRSRTSSSTEVGQHQNDIMPPPRRLYRDRSSAAYTSDEYTEEVVSSDEEE
jgi:hypothetical protein